MAADVFARRRRAGLHERGGDADVLVDARVAGALVLPAALCLRYHDVRDAVVVGYLVRAVVERAAAPAVVG